MTLAKARIVNYDCNSSFIVLATVITIINYDRKTFIVQATGYSEFFYYLRRLIGCRRCHHEIEPVFPSPPNGSTSFFTPLFHVQFWDQIQNTFFGVANIAPGVVFTNFLMIIYEHNLVGSA